MECGEGRFDKEYEENCIWRLFEVYVLTLIKKVVIKLKRTSDKNLIRPVN